MFKTRPIALLALLLAIPVLPTAAQDPAPRTNPAIEKRDGLWDQGMKLAKQGKLGEAAKVFERVYALEESIFGKAHPQLLGTLEFLARIAAFQQDDQAVIQIRKRQHHVTEQLHGKTDYRTQDALRAITDAQQNAARSPEDQARLQQAEQFSQELVKLYGEGNYTAAIAPGKQAAEIRRAVLGKQHPDYAATLNNLALLYDSMGDYPQAEPLYRQAMEIRRPCSASSTRTTPAA